MSFARAAAFLALLLPSAAFVWNNPDAPLFGYQHDDGVYYVTAKAVASGQGYVIPSLPGAPAQTKYPPGLPLTLAAAWLVNPEFPANLRIASWLMWVWLPMLLAVALAFWKRLGLGGWKRWALAATLALNAYVLYFSATFMAEMPFAAFLFAALLAADDESPFASGLLAAAAFLFRTIGLAALALPLLWLWRGERARALRFLAGFLPTSLAWIVWSKLRQAPAPGEIALYYTDYIGYHFSQFEWGSAHLFLWRNVDGFLTGAGGLILPTIYDSQVAHILTQVLAVAAIAGVARLVRGGSRIALYAVAVAVPFTALLLAWSFPPNERFVLPLAPLIWAGFLAEMGHIGGGVVKNLRHPDRGQRVAAGVMAAICLAMLAWILRGNWELRMSHFPQLAAGQRERRLKGEAGLRLIRENIPPRATVLAGYDSELYLRTGRQGARYIPPVRFWYHEDDAGRLRHLGGAADVARRNGLEYLYVTNGDNRTDLSAEQQSAIAAAIAGSAGLELLFKMPEGALYRISGAAR